MGEALALPPRSSFARYWTAAAISSFGSAVTAVAMPVLVVQLLGATPFEVGVVNAAQFVPYALLGLFAGVYTDRWRRKPVLVWASAGRALSLGAIPILWLTGVLRIWLLVSAARSSRRRCPGSRTSDRRRTRRPAGSPGGDYRRA